MLQIVSLILNDLDVNYQVERSSNRHSPCDHHCGECNGDWHHTDETQVVELAYALCGKYVDWAKLRV